MFQTGIDYVVFSDTSVVWDKKEPSLPYLVFTGFVIKDCSDDGHSPEKSLLIGSKVYDRRTPLTIDVYKEKHGIVYPKKFHNIHNSMSEVAAAIDGLEVLAELRPDAEDLSVELRTDYNVVRDIINMKNYKIEEIKDDKKRILWGELARQRDRFGYVECKLIYGNTNLAHNVCEFARFAEEERRKHRPVWNGKQIKVSKKIKMNALRPQDFQAICDGDTLGSRKSASAMALRALYAQ